MPGYSQWRQVVRQLLYQSATLTGTGNGGYLTNPCFSDRVARFPYLLTVVGASITTDETLDVTLDWSNTADGTATEVHVGSTSFTQLTASVLSAHDGWPGDVTVNNVARDLFPMTPYFRPRWTIAGTTQSLSFAAYMSYIELSA